MREHQALAAGAVGVVAAAAVAASVAAAAAAAAAAVAVPAAAAAVPAVVPGEAEVPGEASPGKADAQGQAEAVQPGRGLPVQARAAAREQYFHSDEEEEAAAQPVCQAGLEPQNSTPRRLWVCCSRAWSLASGRGRAWVRRRRRTGRQRARRRHSWGSAGSGARLGGAGSSLGGGSSSLGGGSGGDGVPCEVCGKRVPFGPALELHMAQHERAGDVHRLREQQARLVQYAPGPVRA